jgi:hypothetical protein
MRFCSNISNSEVSKMREASTVQDDVFWLNISMNDLLGVDVIEGCRNACDVEGYIIFVEDDSLSEIMAQIAASFEVQNQEARHAVMKRKMQTNNEGVL